MKLLTLALIAASCATPPPPISLDGSWPSSPGEYERVTQAWTRHDRVTQGLSAGVETVMEVSATFKSPQWRAAHARFAAKARKLPKPEADALLQVQKEEAELGYEVQILFSTYDRRANDLQKNLRSTWRVSLADDQGNEVRPTTIRRDRRPRSEIRAEYEFLGDFHVPYVAVFPKSIDLLRPDAKKFTLRIASSRGGVELVWENGR